MLFIFCLNFYEVDVHLDLGRIPILTTISQTGSKEHNSGLLKKGWGFGRKGCERTCDA